MGCGVGRVSVLLIIYTFILYSYIKEKVFVHIALMLINKKTIYLQRQVLHDQLLQTPPGWEHSKGMWLSGAM